MNKIVSQFMFLYIWLSINFSENKGLGYAIFSSKLVNLASCLYFATRGPRWALHLSLREVLVISEFKTPLDTDYDGWWFCLFRRTYMNFWMLFRDLSLALVAAVVLCTVSCPGSPVLYDNGFSAYRKLPLVLAKWINSYCILKFYVICRPI